VASAAAIETYHIAMLTNLTESTGVGCYPSSLLRLILRSGTEEGRPEFNKVECVFVPSSMSTIILPCNEEKEACDLATLAALEHAWT
jgi:hypothetical protein